MTDDSTSGILLRVEVEDTGIGVSAADQRRIFSAFEQADNSSTRRHGGSGLGLAISRQLAQMMGGDIQISSKPGEGSTFSLTVSLTKATTAPSGKSAPTTPANERLTSRPGTQILLAEDEPTARTVVCELLREAGFTVDAANDGLAAVNLASATHYELILMDIQMPVVNGFDATRAIRLLPGYNTTPILALTANAYEEDRQRCLAAGMNEHLAKPVLPEQLYAAVGRWLPPVAADNAMSVAR
jgi:CheY-like chemotaxis protein